MDQDEVEVPQERMARESFLQYCARMLTELHPGLNDTFMAFFGKIIFDQVKNLGSEPFEHVSLDDDDNTSKVLLKFNEAFVRSLMDIVQMTMFIMVCVAALILTTPLRPRLLQATLVLLAPFYYFPPLLAKAPNFSVICGTFEVPIFQFAFLWALGFSLLQAFVIL